MLELSEPNKVAFETVTSQDVTIDGVTHKCLVAVYPILPEILVQDKIAKKTRNPFKLLHAITPFWLPSAGFEGLEGEFTITFQATRMQFPNQVKQTF